MTIVRRMIHPIPPGTRDVLPDEMRELRRLNRRLIEVFEDSGYGEVATPAIEYDEVLARGDRPSSASPYRFFDENGDLLALRSDMTVPIARLVATRFADAPKPLPTEIMVWSGRVPEQNAGWDAVKSSLVQTPGKAHPANDEPTSLVMSDVDAIPSRRRRRRLEYIDADAVERV